MSIRLSSLELDLARIEVPQVCVSGGIPDVEP